MKRPYFAQTDDCSATGHRSKHCATLAEAQAFLREHGSGSITQRDAAAGYYAEICRVEVPASTPSQGFVIWTDRIAGGK
jgi:hypothetical protein